MRMNEQFGAGFVTLEYLDKMPASMFDGWAAYVFAREADRPRREAQEQHDRDMDHFKKALTH